MKQAILFVNLNRTKAEELSQEIKKELLNRNYMTDIFVCSKGEKFVTDKKYDIAFSLGGDGTVLYAARAMALSGTPIFPVNLGTLGFIAGIHPLEWLKVFDLWLLNNITISKRIMLEASIYSSASKSSQSANTQKLLCLNDFVISSSGKKMLMFNVYIGDGEETQKQESLISLGQFRADGLITATATGSTAYSASAGGPILDPEMEAIILNPISPFTLSVRPLIRQANETFIIELYKIQRSDALLIADGQETIKLEPGDRIYITAFSKPCFIVASDKTVFYNALKTKLSWLGVNNA